MSGNSEQHDEEQKRQLEIQKLLLEQRLLVRQLSLQGLLIEWLKAAAVPVTLLGAILAFFIGFGQLRQTSENQVAERFDKSLTRLASERADERMTGVSGLQLFLHARDDTLQEQTLQFLINALSLETDNRVQGAILDVLAGTTPGSIQRASLNAALDSAVKRNRSLTHLIRGAWRSRVMADKWAKLVALGIPESDVDRSSSDVPAAVVAKLTVEQYLSLRDSDHGPFERLPDNEEVPLRGLTRAITMLIGLGATTGDFRDIYCEPCDFSVAKNLDGAIFDGSFLAGSDFSHASLRNSSFRDADLGGTSFFSADLTGADLSSRRRGDTLTSSGTRQFPFLECAVLIGTDLSGRTLAVFRRDFSTAWAGEHEYQMVMPRLTAAHVDGSTRIDRFSIIGITSVADGYLKAHPDYPEVKNLTTNRNDLWDDPFLVDYWEGVTYRRWHGDFAEDAEKYTSTTVFQEIEIDEKAIKRLGNQAFLLRGYLSQPQLKEIPFFANFVKALSALSIPDVPGAKASNAASEKADQMWAAAKPADCAGKPSEDSLELDNYWYPYATN